MIEIKNLVKHYGDKKAVNDISFTVNDNEILGFLGPNGAGKTTTMNIITGYLSSTSGSVKINGHDILEEPALAKKAIGYLPEQPPLYLDMTVDEYLKFICDLKQVPAKERKEHINTIMDMVGISAVSGRLIGNLSKGYKQRVGLAQALVGDPPILILDEPTVGLDPNQIIGIRKLIKQLSKNHSIIVSSHILSEIQEIADRVVIINHGKVAAVDTIMDLSQRLSGTSKILMSFNGPAKDVSARLKMIPGIADVYIRNAGNPGEVEITLAPKAGNDVRANAFFMMAKSGWPILEFRSLIPSLEEVFLSITAG
ncbi:MAG: ABC transporter ATP-binding protein [Clostridiales bacterium]|nr:ABC transporter ATP-binding protein [Clostridiales bacterium]